MAVMNAAQMVSDMDGDSHTNDQFGSIGELRPGADDGSCKGGKRRTRIWQPLHPETRIDTAVDNDCPLKLGQISAYPTSVGQVSTIIPVKVDGISVVHKPDEWIEIEITVDSGACITVMPRKMCEGISILQNSLSRAGTKYEVANGAHIKNLGERRCEMMTVGSGKSKRITFQVADVHKPLLSISGCADMGYDCYLGKKGGHLVDTETGEMIPLERRENLYVMRAWVRQDPTVSVSQPFVGPG